MDRVTFAHFEALIAGADTLDAVDRAIEELRGYGAANPGDPLAGELAEQLARARQAVVAAASARTH